MLLNEIVARTKQLLEQRKGDTPIAVIERAASDQAATRDFAGALRGEGISLIAEVKRASPSRGPLRLDLDAASLARVYREAGAAAISVLTEPEYFLGSLDDLKAVRAQVDIPVLRKDFVIDPYQVYEARAFGADAVLLIVNILTENELKALLETVHGAGMTALVEVHTQDELMKAWDLSPKVIGINNRNLMDFSVDLQTTLDLRLLVPSDVVVVSESGIHSRDDVLKLQEGGVDAMLVGESLVTSPDPASKIGELLGSPRAGSA